MPLDSATWAALAFVLSAIGAVYTYAAWRRNGLPAGLRGLAWTLLPIAAWMTGTLRLAGQVVDAVTGWAGNLVFDPLMWLGIALAGVSVVLFGVSAQLRHRGIGARQRPAKKPRVGGREAKQVAPPAGKTREPALGTDDDLADIEAILRKHGIR